MDNKPFSDPNVITDLESNMTLIGASAIEDKL